MITEPLIAIIVAVDANSSKEPFPLSESLLECKELAKTAGINAIATLTQSREAPHLKTYIGTGKVQELLTIIKEKNCNLVITDDELSPIQQRNLEKELNVKVLDRTGLILDIFAKRASTFEAKLQVELAQLEYLFPRLTRLWTHLSRQTGGIGTRGPGETQLEVDKRQLKERVSIIKKKLEKVKKQRETRRKNRDKLPLITGAILGYTNAGKSTLLNALTEAGVLAENKLFATLDSTTRNLKLEGHNELTISDTVGFIRKLPHQLVTSFRSTLEEVKNSDFLIHVVDISHPNFEVLIETSNKLLKELGSDNKETIYVFNKMDKVSNPTLLFSKVKKYPNHVFISARKKENLNELKKIIISFLDSFTKTMIFNVPYNKMDVVNLLHKYGKILEENYQESITIKVEINKVIGQKIMGMLTK